MVAGPAGQSPVSAFLMVYRKDRVRGSDVITCLRSIPEVVLCDVVSGDFDLLVRIEARSLERIQEIWEQIAALPGVTDTVTAMTLSSLIRRGAGGARATEWKRSDSRHVRISDRQHGGVKQRLSRVPIQSFFLVTMSRMVDPSWRASLVRSFVPAARRNWRGAVPRPRPSSSISS